jgi:hypothetical protein
MVVGGLWLAYRDWFSGGLLADGSDSSTVLKWSILQKAAATTAVAGGVAVGRFHPRALARR